MRKKINIILMKGFAAGGMKQVRDNFCENLINTNKYDVLVYHNLDLEESSKKLSDPRYIIESALKPYETTFHLNDVNEHLRKADLTIVFGVNPTGEKLSHEEQEKSFIELKRHVDEQHHNGGNVLFMNFGHTQESFIKEFLPYLFMFDKYLTFGPGDGIVKIFKRNSAAEFKNHIEPNMIYQNPNTVYAMKKDWIPFEDKYLHQFYWQGRGLKWKGYGDYKALKHVLHDSYDYDINLMFNGIDPYVWSIQQLAIKDMKPTTYPEWMDYHKKVDENNKPDFSRGIDDKTLVYPFYKYQDGFNLLKKAGFGLYTTRLDRTANFFPEYTTIDIVKAGAVLCLPDWYWIKIDPSKGFLDGEPEDIGAIALPSKFRDDSDESRSTVRKFINTVRNVSTDKGLYDEYRNRAWDVFTDDAKQRNIVDTIITKAMESVK